MDDGVDDDVGPLDVAERTHLRTKENQYLIRPPESSDVVESGEMIIPAEGSFHEIADILDANVLNHSGLAVDGSEQPCASPSFMDDVGNMVQELTVRNYNCSNFAIVGTSNNRDRMQVKLGQWQHLYQLGGASGSGSSRSNALHRDNGQGMPSSLEDLRYSTSSPVFVNQKTSSGDCKEVVEEAANAEIRALSGNMVSHGSIRTKILSKSGFSEFFVKNTLKGKGIIFRGPPDEGVKLVLKDRNAGQAASGTVVNPTTSQNLGVKTAIPCSFVVSEPIPAGSDHDGVLLRHWLNLRQHIMNKVECMHIFKQIVDLVNRSHSEGVPFYDLRPSRFKLLQSNQVEFIGSSAQRDMLTGAVSRDAPSTENHVIRRRPAEQGMLPSLGAFAKKQKISENTNSVRQWPLFTTKYGFTFETVSDGDIGLPSTHTSLPELTEHNPNSEYRNQVKNGNQRNTAQQPMSFVNDWLEQKWYASPEELSEGICTTSSNIYSLGVLLFELLVHFDSERGHATAMADLRHRILPPHFLSRYPKEAGFCLWLLHPEPSSRPTVREVLQSEVINGLQEVCEEELSSTIDQEDAESELLLHFLASLKENKQKHASKLADDIRCIESDIGEVERRTCSKNSLESQLLHVSETNEMRLKNIISQLESAYFSLRSQIQLPKTDAAINHKAKDVLTSRENCCFVMGSFKKENLTDTLGSFFDGLCKYARYSKFEVRGIMRTGESSNSSNVICSLSFDRDLDYFATAGVSKKIKIFEFSSLLNDSVDIHYPAVEMSNESKLSCVCWNNYIKNYLVSTDHDGVVKLWDANTGQRVFQYTEHERRAWSVDFSPVYPTKLASGSDDCAVKLWSVNERNSLGTIKNIANVCCVQFSSHSTHLLAFGSADYRTYCYDLRNVRVPWCVLAGHGKAVSYVKFLDPATLVTASTDNSLKLWDLNKVGASGVSTNACSLTLTGHVNEKNFVGLSVADGYIACGSETNEVYAYYRSLPMPITSHKFGSIDPISGKETDDDNGQFVSSVCWRGKSDTAITANSTGSIKVLQMV